MGLGPEGIHVVYTDKEGGNRPIRVLKGKD